MWNPLTVLLAGIVIGLVAIDAAQDGLDLFTDAITAEAISDLVGSAAVVGASAVGLPVIVGGTEDVSPGLDGAIGGLTNLESPLLPILGLTDLESPFPRPIEFETATKSDFGAFNAYIGEMAKNYVNRNETASPEYTMELTSGKVIRADLYYEQGNSIDESKVGGFVKKGQLSNYAEVIGMEEVNAGSYHAFLSPSTGKIGPYPGWAREALTSIGFQIKTYNFAWWEYFQ